MMSTPKKNAWQLYQVLVCLQTKVNIKYKSKRNKPKPSVKARMVEYRETKAYVTQIHFTTALD